MFDRLTAPGAIGVGATGIAQDARRMTESLGLPGLPQPQPQPTQNTSSGRNAVVPRDGDMLDMVDRIKVRI